MLPKNRGILPAIFLEEAMKPAFSKPVSTALLFLGIVMSLSMTIRVVGRQRGAPAAPAADQAAPAAAGQAQGRGGGGGGGARGGAAAFGDGPWNLGEGPNRMHITVVTKGLDHPWGLAFLPNGDMLVTERPGRLRVIRNGVLDPTPIRGLPQIRAVTLGGLMDIALHPTFAENRWIYFTYSKPGTGPSGIATGDTDGFEEDPAKATLAVGRARWDGGASLTDFKDIFIAQPYYGGRGIPARCCGQGPADGSYGSRIAFDKAGYLYVTSGDRNYGEQSQEPGNDIGKILRLREDGTIPPDNPFIGRAGYRPELYSLGHRNPLGLSFHPVTGELWSSEFGPRGGDEVNRIQAGKNYGWILITNGMHYNGEPTARGRSEEHTSELQSQSRHSVPTRRSSDLRAGYRPELYSLGHRNPLGLSFHPVTGELWSSEFGPRGGDEVNRIQAGKNYGWILITNGMHYNGEPTARGRSEERRVGKECRAR